MTGLAFGEPIFLGLLALFVLISVWWVTREQRNRQEALTRFGEESLLAETSAVSTPRRHLTRLGLRVGALSLGLVALARPQLGERAASLAHNGRDVLVLLDLSRSMNAAAAEPGSPAAGRSNRLQVAKQAVLQVLAASAENRVGLIVFGGSAFLQLPLTENAAAFKRFLDAATTDDLGDPATNLSNALATAATTFQHDGERGYQSVLLVSDGESSQNDDVGPAITRLRRAGIGVFAIGIGTPDGAPVPADSTEAPEQWHRDDVGRIVVSRLEEGDLRRAARETNGRYLRWMPGAGRTIGAALASLGTRTIATREATERVDRFQWPLGVAVVAMTLESLIGVRRRRT